MVIYFDNASGKLHNPIALEIYNKIAQLNGNSASQHILGQKLKGILNASKQSIADILKVKANEIIFLHSATESINTVLKGLALKNSIYSKGIASAIQDITQKAFRHSQTCEVLPEYANKTFKAGNIAHLAAEHSSTRRVINYLSDFYGFNASKVKLDKNGLIDLNDLENIFQNKKPIFFSYSFANAETGVIQPISEIAGLCKAYNIYLHIDCSAAFGNVNIDLSDRAISAATISGYKIGGAHGAALILKDNINIPSFLHGGNSQRHIQTGSLDIASFASFAAAAKNIDLSYNSQIEKIRDYIINGIMALGGEVVGLSSQRLPGHIFAVFRGVQSSNLLFLMDMHKICVSAGSACESGIIEGSNALRDMGYSNKDMQSGLRISLSKNNTFEEAQYFLKVLKDELPKARKAGFSENI